MKSEFFKRLLVVIPSIEHFHLWFSPQVSDPTSLPMHALLPNSSSGQPLDNGWHHDLLVLALMEIIFYKYYTQKVILITYVTLTYMELI